jgi:hypothetical protein
MATQLAPYDAPRPHAPGDPAVGIQSVAQLVATAVHGVHKVNDQFVSVNATLSDDGYIDVEITRVDFTAENSTVRVLFYPTAPVPISSRSVPKPVGVT